MASETAFSGSDQHQLLPEPKPSLNSGSVVIRTLAAAVAGLFGAILSWKAIEYIGEVFVLPADLAGLAFGQIPAPEVQARMPATAFSLPSLSRNKPSREVPTHSVPELSSHKAVTP